MLSDKIVVQNSGIAGRGTFARERIAAGEVTWRASPTTRIVTRDEIVAMSAAERERFYEHAWQFATDKVCAARFDIYIYERFACLTCRRPTESQFYFDDPEVDTSLLMNHSCDPNSWFR